MQRISKISDIISQQNAEAQLADSIKQPINLTLTKEYKNIIKTEYTHYNIFNTMSPTRVLKTVGNQFIKSTGCDLGKNKKITRNSYETSNSKAETYITAEASNSITQKKQSIQRRIHFVKTKSKR